jgi:hypothetical protein
MSKSNNAAKKNIKIISKGSKIIEKYLTYNGIEFKTEVRYTKCKDIRTMPVDYEIQLYGHVALIEYDGSQHYDVDNNFHGGNKQKFIDHYRRDLIKTNYAYINRKSLCRIADCNFDNINMYLDLFVKYVKQSKCPIYIFSNSYIYRHHIKICYGTIINIDDVAQNVTFDNKLIKNAQYILIKRKDEPTCVIQ